MSQSVDADASASAVGSTSPSPSEHIQVCFRVRPFDRRERAAGELPGWEIDTATNVMTRKTATVKKMKQPPQMTFPCSKLFDETTTTADLYASQVHDIVESSMRGINGTVFAYGQTASGSGAPRRHSNET